MRYLPALLLLFVPVGAVCTTTCAVCHPKESAGFAKTPMAHSLSAAGTQPAAVFEHSFSQTLFSIRNGVGGLVQARERDGESQSMTFQYVVGSGAHAFGYLAQVGDHLFQSPLSYYSRRRQWDMAPGYEQDPAPDFMRPVTAGCLACHSGGTRAVAQTLNTYLNPPFEAMNISCERCHGSTEAHLANPVRGTVINPARLPEAERDSICEQCHLAGEVRIPNPGKAITDFRPGETLEQTYTVYVEAHGPEDTVKVISQAEQLALSVCKRRSGARLWCGTCHDPHEQPIQPAAYFRERCLGCHLGTLPRTHSDLTDCIGCHMPQRPAKDGGHTAFTDHRISRHPEQTQAESAPGQLTAWREPSAQLRDRNLALALVTEGMQNHEPAQVIRGYRMLNRLPHRDDDPEVSAAIGSILLTAKEPAEATKSFARAVSGRPSYAPYEVNLATSLVEDNRREEAAQHLERALDLDPLLEKAIWELAGIYRSEGQETKAAALVARYRAAMGITAAQRKP